MLDGPNFIPKDPRRAVILCHGYGADGHDLFGLVPGFSAELPGAAFFCPNAPGYTEFGGRQWFGLEGYDPQNIQKSLAAANQKAADAASIVREYAAKVCQDIGIPAEHLVIGGFSQGGLMAMHAAYDWEGVAVAGVVALSAVPPVLTQVRNKVPTFVTHGMQDTIVPYMALDMTRDTLDRLGINAQFCVQPEMGHDINSACARAACDFIKEVTRKF
ncbi:MAG: alpha/beta hydrolase [Alphaproteobacteria bacterium]|nr:alpha/beta hydrolase [Alphaproteobacteria bacterium]